MDLSATADDNPLCRAFDQATQQGADMGEANRLLGAVLASIRQTFQKRAASALAGSRTAVLPTRAEQVTEATEFELIT